MQNVVHFLSALMSKKVDLKKTAIKSKAIIIVKCEDLLGKTNL